MSELNDYRESIKYNFILPMQNGFTHDSNTWSGYTIDNNLVEITRVNGRDNTPLCGQDKNLVLKIHQIVKVNNQNEITQRINDCLIQALCKIDSCAYTSIEPSDKVIITGISPVYKLGIDITKNNAEIIEKPRNIMTITAAKPLEYLGKSFLQAFNNNYLLNIKERFSYSLFSTAHFSLDTVSSILLIVSALETLSDQKKVDPKIRNILDIFINYIKNNEIGDEDIDELKSGICNLKKESKTKGLQRLVSPFTSLNPISWLTESGDNYRRDPESIPQRSMDISDFIKYCYKIRSKIVHGELDNINIEELPGINSQLSYIYKRIISKKLVRVNYIT